MLNLNVDSPDILQVSEDLSAAAMLSAPEDKLGKALLEALDHSNGGMLA